MLPTDSDAALDARVQALSDDDLAALAADGCAAELARYRPHDLLKRLVAEVQAARASSANLRTAMVVRGIDLSRWKLFTNGYAENPFPPNGSS